MADRRKRLGHSLKVRILRPALLMMLVLVLILTVVVSWGISDLFLENEKTKTLSSMQIVSENISDMLEENYTPIPNLMEENPIISYLHLRSLSDYELVQARIRMIETMDAYLLQHSNVHGLIFINGNGQLFGKLSRRSLFMDRYSDTKFDENIIRDAMDIAPGEVRLAGPYRSEDIYGYPTSGAYYPEKLVAFEKKLAFAPNEYRTVFVLYDANVFEKYLPYIGGESDSILLVTADGQEIGRYGSDDPLLTGTVSLFSRGTESCEYVDGEQGQCLSVVQKVKEYPLYLARQIPMEHYRIGVRNLQVVIWAISVTVMLALVLVYLHWLNGFLSSFQALKNSIRELKAGHLETRLKQQFEINEFEDIREEFNEMNQSLELQMETNMALERSKAEVEMRYLQTQLTPHMVFNSISAIRSMAEIVGAEEVSDMLSELAEMMRPVFRELRLKWSLREELEHLQHYASLLNLRYGSDLEIICDIPDELKDIELPRFTIQPLVENACEHGRSNVKKLVIRIRAYLENDGMNLTVYNNGKNISPENIQQIRDMIERDAQGTGLGVYNVYARLTLCMGKDSKLDITCPPEGGTLVIIQWKVRP